MKDITHYFSSPDKSPDGHINGVLSNNDEEPKDNELHCNIKGIKRKKTSNRSKNDTSRKKRKSEHEELFKKSVRLHDNEPNNIPLVSSQVNLEPVTTLKRDTDKSNASNNLSVTETSDDSNLRLVIEDSEDSDGPSKTINRKYHKVKRKKVNNFGSPVRLVKPRPKREKKSEIQNESVSVTTNDTNNLRKLNLCKLNITVSKQIRISKDVSFENTVMLVPESANINRSISQSDGTVTNNAPLLNSNDLPINDSDDCKSKNNLLSYFSKVPKVDVFRNAEKFEVRAVVHPPPFIPSCRSSNKETNVKLFMRKKKSSAENVTDADKIEFVRSEVLDSDNVNVKNPDKVITKEELSASKSWKMRIRLRDAPQESGMEDVESDNVISYACLPKEVDKKENVILPRQKTAHSGVKCRLAMFSPKENSTSEDAPKYNYLKDKNPLVQQKVTKNVLRNTKSRLAMHLSDQNMANGNSTECEDKRAESPLVRPKTESRLDLNVTKENVVNTLPSDKKVTRSSMKLNLPMETVDTETVKFSSKENKSTPQKNISNVNKPGCVKLAPVFTQNSKKKNKNVDQHSVCARNKFLQSGVPEAVKRMVDTQRIAQDLEERTSVFPIISHVQQKNIESFVWNLPIVDFKFVDSNSTDICIDKWQLGSIINLSNLNIAKSCKAMRPPLLQTFRKVLQEMKSDFPKFPVYRTFKKLYERNCEFKKNVTITDFNVVNGEKKKLRNKNSEKEQPHSCSNCESNLIWTEKYKPLCCEEVIGSNSAKKKLKKWLESWKLWSNGSNKSIKKMKKAKSSSDDEFNNFDSESDSRSSSDTPDTTVLLTGTYGSGKTSAVYAIANELGFKVIEINASSKRTGKRILSKIQEATQSHQVQSSESSVSDIKKFLKQPKKKSKKKGVQHKKAVQQVKEEVKSKMSLILVEDADIVFEEQDEGFIGALSSLAATSKRPVILVANNGDCPHLAKFKDQHMHIKFDEFCPDELSIWLQLICLVEGLKVDNSAIKTLLEYCKCDVRKCLLQLQVWVLSGGDNLLEYDTNSVKQYESKPVIEQVDESSNMSWSFEKSVNSDTSLFLPVHKNCVQILTNTNCNTWEQNFPSTLDLDGIWWNLAPLLNLPQVKLRFTKDTHQSLTKKQKNHTLDDDFLFYDSYDEICDQNEECHLNKPETELAIGTSSEIKPNVTGTDDFTNDKNDNKCHDSIPLEVMAELMDTLSCVDLLSANMNKHFHTFGIRNLDLCPWQNNLEETNSLEQNKMQPQNMMTSSITKWLAENSIFSCRRHLSDFDQPKYDHTQPREECRKWISDQHLLSTAVWDIVPVSCWLNRTAMAADYGSFFRRICRVEKIRFEKELKSSRRRNRFFHYLKELGTIASVDTCHAMSLLFETECD